MKKRMNNYSPIRYPWVFSKQEYFIPHDLPDRCVAVSQEFISSMQSIKGREHQDFKFGIAMNLFYWHMAKFNLDENPEEDLIIVMRNLCRSIVSYKSQKPSETIGSKHRRKKRKIGEIYGQSWNILKEEDFFKNTAVRLNNRFRANNVSLTDFVKDKTILDCGAGCGNYSAAMAAFGAKRIVATDIGKGGLEVGRKMFRGTEYAGVVEFHQASSHNLPFESSSFDVVFCNSVIHVTEQYEESLSEISRVLRKGGELFLYVDGKMGLFELLANSLLCALDDTSEADFIDYGISLGVPAGRLGWIVSNLFVPYERRSKSEIRQLLAENGLHIKCEFFRGLESDHIEKIGAQKPFAKLKYGEGEARFICVKK